MRELRAPEVPPVRVREQPLRVLLPVPLPVPPQRELPVQVQQERVRQVTEWAQQRGQEQPVQVQEQ